MQINEFEINKIILLKYNWVGSIHLSKFCKYKGIICCQHNQARMNDFP